MTDRQRWTAPVRTRPIPLTAGLIDRFWAKVDRSGGPRSCWMWQGKSQNGGYGVIHLGGKKTVTAYAHRISSFIETGRDPIDFLICHTCDTPGCVNPAHLFEGSVADNVADMLAKGRPTCLGRRHPTHPDKVLRGEQKDVYGHLFVDDVEAHQRMVDSLVTVTDRPAMQQDAVV